MVSSILFASLLLVAILGLAIGYYFKPLVLWIVTAIIALCTLFVLVSVLRDGGFAGWGGVIFFGLLAKAIALLLPMWLTHLVKRTRRDGAWWKKVKEKTLD